MPPDWIKSFAEIDQNQIFENLISGTPRTDGTQAYQASSGKVYLATDHVSRGWDYQKMILSEINEKFGPQRHLPEIKYLGRHRDLDVFEMKYYRTLQPEEWAWQDENDQIRLVQDINLAIPLEEQLSDENIEQIYFQESDEDKRWDWADVVDAINLVVKYVSKNYPNCHVELDSWIDNFALNFKYGRSELILLDVVAVRCEE